MSSTQEKSPEGVVYLGLSLDGFIAGPNGELDWLGKPAEGDDLGFGDFMASVDALIMGRATHDMVRSFGQWPYGDKRCIVMSRSAGKCIHNEEFFAGTPAELRAKMHAEGRGRLYVDGGRLVRAFLAAGLIHELILTIMPVLLGRGIALFGDEVPRTNLELMSCEKLTGGMTQLHYRVQ